jgi:hypothetical protein
MTRADDVIVSVRIAGYTERRSIENSLAKRFLSRPIIRRCALDFIPTKSGQGRWCSPAKGVIFTFFGV